MGTKVDVRSVGRHVMLQTLLCLVGIGLGAGVVKTAELTNFRPSSMRTEYGVSSEVEFSTGLVEVESGALAHHLPQAMKEFSFTEPVWVIGYKTDILDSRGRRPQ